MPFSPSQIAAAYAQCEATARGHYENFPVASLLLPKDARRHVAAVYAFARQADDYADEPAYEGRRLERLAQWDRWIDDAAAGCAEHPTFIALSQTISERALPVELLHDLVRAFTQDVKVSGYSTFEELLAYCRLSANPVGRIVLHLCGHREERLFVQSDAICTALQLANFWQDVAIDLGKGRCYIPLEDLARFRCSREDLRGARITPAFTELMRFEIDRTRTLFGRGAGLPARIGGRLGIELRLVVLGGLRILQRIEQAGYDIFRRRPTLTAPDWGRLLLKVPWH